MLAALVLVGVAGIAAAAQERAARSRDVSLALVESLSRPGLLAEILRFPGPNRRDVILLPREATAETLAAALIAYREGTRGTPARRGLIGRIGVTDLQLGHPRLARIRARAARMLAQVRSERPSQLGRYGRGRWTTIQVPRGR
jgi:hypothetical protein